MWLQLVIVPALRHAIISAGLIVGRYPGERKLSSVTPIYFLSMDQVVSSPGPGLSFTDPSPVIVTSYVINQLLSGGGGTGFLVLGVVGLTVIILNPPFFWGRTISDQRKENRKMGMTFFITIVVFHMLLWIPESTDEFIFRIRSHKAE